MCAAVKQNIHEKEQPVSCYSNPWVTVFSLVLRPASAPAKWCLSNCIFARNPALQVSENLQMNIISEGDRHKECWLPTASCGNHTDSYHLQHTDPPLRMPVRVRCSARRVSHHTHTPQWTVRCCTAGRVPEKYDTALHRPTMTLPPPLPHPTCRFYPIAQISRPPTGRLGGGRSTEEGKRKK